MSDITELPIYPMRRNLMTAAKWDCSAAQPLMNAIACIFPNPANELADILKTGGK